MRGFLLVVAGALPVSNGSVDGLLSANMYNKIMRPYMGSGYPLYKIHDANQWTRKVAAIVGSNNGQVFQISIGNYLNDTGHIIRFIIFGNIVNFVKFYRKNGELYVFFDNPSSGPANILMSSTDSISLVSTSVQPDNSYTEVDVESNTIN